MKKKTKKKQKTQKKVPENKYKILRIPKQINYYK